MPSYPESEYCTFLYADGRRCRTLKMPTRQVCLAHYKHDGQFEEDEAAVLELSQRSRSLDTAGGVARALASLFRLTVQGKIPQRKAALLAYMGHLMLCGHAQQRKAGVRAELEQGLTASEVPVPAGSAFASLQAPAAMPAGANGKGSQGPSQP